MTFLLGCILALASLLSSQGAIGTPLIGGSASWCAPTPKYCHGWGGNSVLAAVPGYRGSPYWANVCRQDRPKWCVRVYVHSVCKCASPKVIDITPHAFSDRWKQNGRWQGLGAPLSRGVIAVEVEVLGDIRLPQTDAAS